MFCIRSSRYLRYLFKVYFAYRNDKQCSGSMTFWCGSGSADPCLKLMDPDPNPDLLFLSLTFKMPTKNKFFKKVFLYITFLRYLYIIFKVKKMSQNRRNQGFSYYICLMIEGSGSGSRAGSESGSIPLTNGSGSWRPKNTWIRIR
jgi:hypothetical protein